VTSSWFFLSTLNGTSSSMKFGEVPVFLMISQQLKKDYIP